MNGGLCDFIELKCVCVLPEGGNRLNAMFLCENMVIGSVVFYSMLDAIDWFLRCFQV